MNERSYTPVTSRGGSIAPTSRGGSVVPASRRGSVAPASRGGSVAPASRGGSAAPVSRGGSAAPGFCGGSVALASRRGSAAPSSRVGSISRSIPSSHSTSAVATSSVWKGLSTVICAHPGLQTFADFPQTITHAQSPPPMPVFDPSQLDFDFDMEESQLPYDYDTRCLVDDDGVPFGYENIRREQPSVSIIFFVYPMTHSTFNSAEP